MHGQHLVGTVMLLLVVGVLWCRAESEPIQPKLVLDDFEADQLGPWWVSKSSYISHFSQQGTNQEGLQLAQDGERGGQEKNDHFFITRTIAPPKPTVAYAAVAFWYRTRGTIPKDAALCCRLGRERKASGTSFMDMALPADTQGQWRHVELPGISSGRSDILVATG